LQTPAARARVVRQMGLDQRQIVRMKTQAKQALLSGIQVENIAQGVENLLRFGRHGGADDLLGDADGQADQGLAGFGLDVVQGAGTGVQQLGQAARLLIVPNPALFEGILQAGLEAFGMARFAAARAAFLETLAETFLVALGMASSASLFAG